MRVLLTGAAGFIGFHVGRRLLKDGHDVVGLDVVNDYYDVRLKEARLDLLRAEPQFTFVRLALEDESGIGRLFEEHAAFDRVIHLAAQAGVRYSLERPDVYVKSNVTGFLHILEGCARRQVPHLVYASSSSVYGASTRMPFALSDPAGHPLSLYGATKRANELMAHAYSYLFKLPTTGLRFFTVYGPWGRPDMVLFKFTKAIMEGHPIDVFNHGKMQRDFTYVDDVVESVVRLMDIIPAPDTAWKSDAPHPGSGPAPFRLYNVGNHTPVDLSQVIKWLEEALDRKAKVNLLPMQAGDVPSTYADVEALEAVTGFRPQTSMREGVLRFVEWYKEFYCV